METAGGGVWEGVSDHLAKSVVWVKVQLKKVFRSTTNIHASLNPKPKPKWQSASKTQPKKLEPDAESATTNPKNT